MKVLTEERQQKILDLLEASNVIKLSELSDMFTASESTVRRDLDYLAEQGLLKRIHGGAQRITNKRFETNLKEKIGQNSNEKKAIGMYASQLVNEGDCIFLDAGSTIYEMIPFLKGKEITVVTNSVHHASLLSDLAIPTIILGGGIKMTTNAVVGSTTESQIETFNFDAGFVGTNGIDIDRGLTTPDTEEAAIKRLALTNSKRKYILADSTKFAEVGFVKFFDLDVDLIITSELDNDVREKYKELPIKEII